MYRGEKNPSTYYDTEHSHGVTIDGRYVRTYLDGLFLAMVGYDYLRQGAKAAVQQQNSGGSSMIVVQSDVKGWL